MTELIFPAIKKDFLISRGKHGTAKKYIDRELSLSSPQGQGVARSGRKAEVFLHYLPWKEKRS